MEIAIIGGGTAAWLTAAYLSKKRPYHRLTIIDKTDSTPIGVGEATILDFAPFMKECGFEVEHWLSKVDGAMKSGILFPDWGHVGNQVWHPFNTHTTYPGYGQWDIWAVDQSTPFETHGLPMFDISKQNKVNIHYTGHYAYHIDCLKLVKYIQYQLQNKVILINSDVVQVNKNNKNIESIVLDNGNTLHADLFVDCTGFNSVLKDQDKVDVTDRLFCNTAVAGHVPYLDKQSELTPYVTSGAVGCGWIWEIPIESRIGSGIVFNRDITSVDEAMDTFINHWDNRVNKDDLRVIKWDPYYIKNFWEGNVVSIGLSGGFIEPLESTGLSMMIKGITRLSDKIGIGNYTKFDIDLYNAQMISIYDDTIDFINMHYSNSSRTEPFWQYVKEKLKPSAKLEYCQALLLDPTVPFDICTSYVLDNKMFHVSNWLLWLIQLRYPVKKQLRLPPAQVNLTMKQFRNLEEQRTRSGISHLDALEILKLASEL